jgi:serine phosphatase RsbU (regulator of sigma subunit)
MTIRRRIALSFISILLLFGTAVAVFLWSAELRARSMDVLARALNRQVLIASIRQDLDNLHKEVTLLGNMDFATGEASDAPEARQPSNSKIDSVAEKISRLATLVEPADRQQIEQLRNTYADVAKSWKEFYDYLGVEQTWAVADAARAEPKALLLQRDLIPNLEQREHERVERAKSDFERVQVVNRRLTLAIFGISGLLAAAVAFVLSRRIARGFAVLKHGTEVVGHMDLAHRIEMDHRDELGDFADSFNEMAEHLLHARNELTAANIELERRAAEIAERQQRELQLAATIQQGLMQVRIPELPFARIRGANISCVQIGGDFFDVVHTDEGLAVIVTDVSGKGISAAIMASMIQGMVRAHLAARVPLAELAAVVNGFFTQREVAGKYATMVIVRLKPNGEAEYVNCGHIYPLVVGGGRVRRLSESNPPVGLLPGLRYTAGNFTLRADDRLLLVTDGVTEAANCDEEFFGDTRLEECVLGASPFDDVFAALSTFCSGTPFSDDCTVVEISYMGVARREDSQILVAAAS